MCTVDQDRARARLQLLNRGNIVRDAQIKKMREDLDELRQQYLSMLDEVAAIKATIVLHKDDGR